MRRLLEDVATDEAALHALLPPGPGKLQVWVSGKVSARARGELEARGWEVHDDAARTLAEQAR